MHGAIDFGFSSQWLKNWRESFKPISKCSNRNCIITLDSRLKSALKHQENAVKLVSLGNTKRKPREIIPSRLILANVSVLNVDIFLKKMAHLALHSRTPFLLCNICITSDTGKVSIRNACASVQMITRCLVFVYQGLHYSCFNWKKQRGRNSFEQEFMVSQALSVTYRLGVLGKRV